MQITTTQLRDEAGEMALLLRFKDQALGEQGEEIAELRAQLAEQAQLIAEYEQLLDAATAP